MLGALLHRPAGPSPAAGPLPRSGPRQRVPAIGCGWPDRPPRSPALPGWNRRRKTPSRQHHWGCASDTCTGWGWTPAASGRRRWVDGGVDLEALRRHHLEGLTSPISPTSRFDDAPYSSDVHWSRAAVRAGEPGHSGSAAAAPTPESSRPVGHRVVVGPVDAFVGAVPVHRVGDQGDGALVVTTAARSVASSSSMSAVADRRRPARAAVPGGGRSRRRRADHAPDSGGTPASSGWRRAAAIVCQRCSGSPRSGHPSACAEPHRVAVRIVSAEGAPAPMNDQRDHDRPFSADSSRNVPGGWRPRAVRRQRVSLSARTFAGSPVPRGCWRPAPGNSSRVVVDCNGYILPDPPAVTDRRSLSVHETWRPCSPKFELPDQTGTVRSLSSLLADGPIVLFFYPAAMTPGCTKACHFRDLAGDFAAGGRPGHQHGRGGQAGPVRRLAGASTTHCCPTPTALSRRRSSSAGCWVSSQPVKRHVRHRHRPDGAGGHLQ